MCSKTQDLEHKLSCVPNLEHNASCVPKMVDFSNTPRTLPILDLDRKQINVDPKIASPGDNTTRLRIKSKFFEEVVFYDHTTRGKA